MPVHDLVVGDWQRGRAGESCPDPRAGIGAVFARIVRGIWGPALARVCGSLNVAGDHTTGVKNEPGRELAIAGVFPRLQMVVDGKKTVRAGGTSSPVSSTLCSCPLQKPRYKSWPSGAKCSGQSYVAAFSVCQIGVEPDQAISVVSSGGSDRRRRRASSTRRRSWLLAARITDRLHSSSCRCLPASARASRDLGTSTSHEVSRATPRSPARVRHRV